MKMHIPDTHLLHLVIPLVKRQDIIMRESISLHERLSCTLEFLDTGTCSAALFTQTSVHTDHLTIQTKLCN